MNNPSHPVKRDGLAAIFLLIALQVATSQLVATGWAEDLYPIQALVFLGGLVGLALGSSSFRPAIAAFFSIAYGVFAIPWQLGLTLGPGIMWTERLASLTSSLKVTFNLLQNGENVTNPLLIVLILAIIYWGISVHAGFSLTRKRLPLWAVLPMGLIMVIVEFYSVTVSSWYLAVYVFVALLLIARNTIRELSFEWKTDDILYPRQVPFDLMLFSLLAAGIFVLGAWVIPARIGSMPAVQQTWQRVSAPLEGLRQEIKRTLYPLKSSVGLQIIGLVNDYYGDSLVLGRGQPLSEDLVLKVETPLPEDNFTRYYWRARHYDTYADGQWESNFTATVSLIPDEFYLSFPDHIGRWEANFKFTNYSNISTLYTPAEPEWISRPVEVELLFNPDNTADVAALHATQTLRPGEVYEAQASISNVTVAQLRAAGNNYPAWITDRYLQIADSTTDRTRELAHEIAGGLENPYDIAAAVTEYLRDNITYEDSIPSLPFDQEPIDWLLFDLKRGFCNYYATAEVILLRELGIPARLTVGYAQGDRILGPEEDPEIQGGADVQSNLSREVGEIYEVRLKNAHAWPEVYFPDIGWIEFEPTVNQDPLIRPSGIVSLDAGSGRAVDGASDPLGDASNREDLIDEEFDPSQDLNNYFDASFYLGILVRYRLLIFLVAVLLLWRVLRSRGLPPLVVLLETGMQRLDLHPPHILKYWAAIAALTPMELAFFEINRSLRRLGSQPLPANTPSELARRLIQIMPAAKDPVRTLLVEYQSSIYSLTPGNLEIARQSSRAIRYQTRRERVTRWKTRISQVRGNLFSKGKVADLE